MDYEENNATLTDDPVMLKIMEELKRQKKTGKELEQAIGLGNGAFSRWKYVDVSSYMRYIDQIAEFLNVTPEYLQSMPEKKVEIGNLTDIEKKIILAYRRMESDERKCMLQAVEIFVNSSELKRIQEKSDMYSKKNNSGRKASTETDGDELKSNGLPHS